MKEGQKGTGAKKSYHQTTMKPGVKNVKSNLDVASSDIFGSLTMERKAVKER